MKRSPWIIKIKCSLTMPSGPADGDAFCDVQPCHSAAKALVQ